MLPVSYSILKEMSIWNFPLPAYQVGGKRKRSKQSERSGVQSKKACEAGTHPAHTRRFVSVGRQALDAWLTPKLKCIVFCRVRVKVLLG